MRSEHVLKVVVTLETERTAIIYIYIYNVEKKARSMKWAVAGYSQIIHIFTNPSTRAGYDTSQFLSGV